MWNLTPWENLNGVVFFSLVLLEGNFLETVQKQTGIVAKPVSRDDPRLAACPKYRLLKYIMSLIQNRWAKSNKRIHVYMCPRFVCVFAHGVRGGPRQRTKRRPTPKRDGRQSVIYTPEEQQRVFSVCRKWVNFDDSHVIVMGRCAHVGHDDCYYGHSEQIKSNTIIPNPYKQEP